MIVIDASAMTSAIATDDELGRSARRRLVGDPDQHAPALLDLEVVSAVRTMLRRGLVDDARAAQAVADLAAHPVVRYQHVALLPRIWELRHHVTPYDAAYVALAEALGATLVTADRRLARAPGMRCAVELLA